MEEKGTPQAEKPIVEKTYDAGSDPETTHEKTETSPVFVFDGKTGKDSNRIPIELLSKSIRRESGLKGIRVIPIQYWKIYAIILGMLDKESINHTEKAPFIQNNSSKAYLTDADEASGYTQKNAPINRWRFDKVISTIQLPGIVEDQNEGIVDTRNAAIGLTLNKEGLTVAFGMNVRACKNFNVMGGTIMRSYGLDDRIGLPWDIMETRLHNWVKNINQIWTVQNEIMHSMKDHTLEASSTTMEPTGIIEKVIGDLYLGAIKHSYFNGDAVPFNAYELSDFVQESIRQRKDEEKITNVWDLYNWGTSIMKPGIVDIGEISENSNMWSDYLINEFALEVPKLEILS